MKAILTIVFFLFIQTSYSQTDSEKPQKKPSWGSKMPTRESAPNLKFGADLDEEDEMDMGEFGMDRSRLLDSEETESEDLIEIETPVVTSAEELQKQESEKIREQQRKAEEAKIAAEQLKEQQRKAEEEKIALEQAKEKQRLEEERRIAEKISEESSQTVVPNESVQDNAIEEGQLTEVLVKAPAQIQPYLWKKIRNKLPIYPTRAARDKKEGWVEVNITIDPTGEVVEAVVVKSSNNYRIFNNSALKAVRKWKFEPPSNFGVNNQLSKVVRIVFRL